MLLYLPHAGANCYSIHSTKKITMDKGTAIIGIIILLLCIVPFVIMHYNTKKRKQKILAVLKKAALKDHHIIDQHDVWSHSAIGLCTDLQYLYGIRIFGEQVNVFVADLSLYNKCTVHTEKRTQDIDGEKYSFPEKISLHFSNSNSSVSFEIYNTEVDSLTITDEINLAEKWKHIANDCIKGLNPAYRA